MTPLPLGESGALCQPLGASEQKYVGASDPVRLQLLQPPDELRLPHEIRRASARRERPDVPDDDVLWGHGERVRSIGLAWFWRPWRLWRIEEP